MAVTLRYQWPPKTTGSYEGDELPVQNESTLGFGDKPLSQVPYHQPVESVDAGTNLIRLNKLATRVTALEEASSSDD